MVAVVCVCVCWRVGGSVGEMGGVKGCFYRNHMFQG